MPSLDLLLTFSVTTAIFVFVPGPAMLYAAARALAGGRAAGFMASLGIHLGDYALLFSTPAMARAYRKARRWIEGPLAVFFGVGGLRLLWTWNQR